MFGGGWPQQHLTPGRSAAECFCFVADCACWTVVRRFAVNEVWFESGLLPGWPVSWMRRRIFFGVVTGNQPGCVCSGSRLCRGVSVRSFASVGRSAATASCRQLPSAESCHGTRTPAGARRVRSARNIPPGHFPPIITGQSPPLTPLAFSPPLSSLPTVLPTPARGDSCWATHSRGRPTPLGLRLRRHCVLGRVSRRASLTSLCRLSRQVDHTHQRFPPSRRTCRPACPPSACLPLPCLPARLCSPAVCVPPGAPPQGGRGGAFLRERGIIPPHFQENSGPNPLSFRFLVWVASDENPGFAAAGSPSPPFSSAWRSACVPPACQWVCLPPFLSPPACPPACLSARPAARLPRLPARGCTPGGRYPRGSGLRRAPLITWEHGRRV